MLQNLREASKSWVVRGFMAILVFAFIFLWGVNDVFNPGSVGRQNIATVGSMEISLDQLKKETRKMALQYQQRFGQLPNEAQLIPITMGHLLRNALLDQEADYLGLTISDQQILAVIKENNVFADNTGQFNPKLFEAIAQSQGLTAKAFEEELRKEMRRDQLIQMVSAGVHVPHSIIKPLFIWNNEKRTVDLAKINPSMFKNIEDPSQVEMSAFYEAHKNEFVTRESRNVTVAIHNMSTIEKNITLSDEETQAAFTARKSNATNTLPSKAETEKILKDLKAEKASETFNQQITTIENDISAGLTLEEIAKKFDMKLISIEELAADGSSKNKLNISQEILAETVQEGFKMQPGEDAFLSQISEREYIAVRLDKVQEARNLSFEEVSSKIKENLLQEKQRQEAKKLADTLVEKVNAGESLDALAKTHKLEVKKNIQTERSKSPSDEMTPSAIALTFDTILNKAAIALGKENTLVVLIPRKTISLDEKSIKDEEVKRFSEALNNGISNDLMDQYYKALENRYKVKINQQALNALMQ